MKETKSITLKYIILSLGILTTIVSCNKNVEIIEHGKKETDEIKIEKINIENFQQEKNIFNEIYQHLDIISNQFANRNTKQQDKIIILTDKILKTKKNNIITYSFMLEKPTSDFSDIENLMIFKYPSGNYKFLIIQYKYTQNIDEPYLVKVKKISTSEFKKFDYKIKHGKRYREGGIGFDDCIEVSYTCPYGGTTEHGSSVCGPHGNGPGSTMLVDVSNCFFGGDNFGFDINSPGLNPNHGGNNGYNLDNSNSGGSSTGSSGNYNNTGGGTGAAVLCMDTDDGCIRQYHIELEFLLNITDQKLLDYLKQNRNFAEKVLNFYQENIQDELAKEFATKVIKTKVNNPSTIINFNIIPFTNSSSIIDYVKSIKSMTSYLKTKGERELGEYIESLTPYLKSFTLQEVKDIYKFTRKLYLALKGEYMMTIFSPDTLNDIFFIVDYGLTTSSLKTYQTILSKIPNNYLVRTAKLEIFVKQIGLMGKRGDRTFVRIVTTSNPVKKATSLFEKLTKNALTKKTLPNGTIITNMGNGNIIKFRPLSASSSGFKATIDLEFKNIWAKTRNIKFK